MWFYLFLIVERSQWIIISSKFDDTHGVYFEYMTYFNHSIASFKIVITVAIASLDWKWSGVFERNVRFGNNIIFSLGMKRVIARKFFEISVPIVFMMWCFSQRKIKIDKRTRNFTYFYFRQNSCGCLLAIAVKNKLNDADCSQFDSK